MRNLVDRATFVGAGLVLTSLTTYVGLVWLAELRLTALAGRYPVTTSALAAVLLLPVELIVVYLLVKRIIDRQRRRRWAAVVEELNSSIGQRWNQLRDLMIWRYGLDHLEDWEDKIARADEAWEDLESQEAAMDEDVRGSAHAQWYLPSDLEERLAAVQGLWLTIWAAGVDADEQALAARLTNVLLPRLAPEDPVLTVAVRRLTDAVEDLSFTRNDLKSWEDPFPSSPFVDDPDSPSIIAEGTPSCSRAALQQLSKILNTAGQVVAEGNSLKNLLDRGASR